MRHLLPGQFTAARWRGVLIGALVLVCVAVLGLRTGQAFAAAPRTVVHPRWTRLASPVIGVSSGAHGVLVGTGYLALMSPSGAISLLDEQTGARQPLSPPDCASAGPVGFGGPWLAVACASQDTPGQTDLYDLSSGQWTQLPLPQTCAYPSSCGVDGVGATWIRFLYSSDFPDGHYSYTGYLQDISTGAVEEDPVDEFGGEDNLDTSSGDGQPCVGLSPDHYELDSGSSGLGPSTWTQLGHFVLSSSTVGDEEVDHLQRCGTDRRLELPSSTVSSDKALAYQIGGPEPPRPIVGFALPGLRTFVVPRPKGFLVGLSGTTLYTLVDGAGYDATLWAGTFTR